MGPHIKWKLKETLRALFAFYYGKLKLLHNSGLKWAQHGTKIDLNFRLTSCWFMTRLVCNFPDSVIGTHTHTVSRQTPPAHRASSAVWVTQASDGRSDKDLCSGQKRPFSFLTHPPLPPTPQPWKWRAEKAEFHRRLLVLGSLNCSQKPFLNLLCLSGIN